MQVFRAFQMNIKFSCVTSMALGSTAWFCHIWAELRTPGIPSLGATLAQGDGVGHRP